MTLLMAMLPFYLLGNFHCLGMCGPLAMMIGAHRYRYLYLAGRMLAFSMAGMLAGAVGAVSNLLLSHYHLSALTSVIFGSTIIVAGLSQTLGWPALGGSILGKNRLSQKIAQFGQRTSLLLLRDKPLATFLFGFFTIALPCGQSLVVFSACALTESPMAGLLNGFAFAALTSPALFFAMHAHTAFPRLHLHYNVLMGYGSIAIGTLALLRGFAAMELISHFSLSIPLAHPIVIF